MSKRIGVPGSGHIRNALQPPAAAAGYFGKSGTTNWEPALLWLVIPVVVMNVWRSGGKLPDGPQAVTWLGLSAGVVVAGAILPEVVASLLVGLLFAGALNLLGPIQGVVAGASQKVADLGIGKA